MATKSKQVRFNPDDILKQIVSSDFDLTRFAEIDERDIPKAPNFIDWIVGRNFCDQTLLPWQVEAGMHLFSDYCPKCSDPEYLTELFNESLGEIQDHVQFLEFGVCPKCHSRRMELFSPGEFHPSKPSIKNEFIGNLGQRAGKTLGESTEILTPLGPVAIRDIQVGDTVYGWNRDGSVSETKVVNKFDHGIKPVRDLTTRGRKLASCTDEHRWLTVRANGYYRGNIALKELQLKEFIGNKDIGIYRKFVAIPCGEVTEPHAYAIGALLGDGCSRQGTRNTIDISSHTEHVPKHVAQVLGATVQRSQGGTYTWHLRKNKLWSQETLQCAYYTDWCKGRYAHEKICDLEVLKTWDRQTCLKFLAGLIDTDGSVHVTGRKRLTIQFGCQSKSIVEAFAYLIYRLFQYKSLIREDKRDKYKNGHVYYAKVSSSFHAIRALQELDPFLCSPSRKWKPEYLELGTHNSHEDFIKPKVGAPYSAQTYDIEVGNETNLYVLAHEGLITHNSKLVACASSYQVHQWVSLPDPVNFYNLPKMEIVLGTFSALSAEQAEENLWMPFTGLVDNSPWFKKYHEFLRSEGKRLSVPLCNVKDSFILYVHKRLNISFTGSDDRKKKGRTRLFGAIDEIAFLNSEEGTSKKKVMDADKNYSALTNSLATIRQKAMNKLVAGENNVPMAIMYNASSPYNVQDKIMRLTKSGPENPFALVIHRATWEANPDFTEKTCRAINPSLSTIEFERDFGAVPPFSDAPFIGDVRAMEKLCQSAETYQPILLCEKEIHTDAMGDRYLYLKAKPVKTDKGLPLLLALDNGYSQNAFGAALIGYDGVQKKPQVRFLANLYPEPSAGLNIHFPSMFEHFILPIIKAFNIKHVVYDRWQSLDQIQRLREMKIEAIAHSLSFEKDILPFKQMLLSGNMVLPPCELVMQTVKDAPNPLLMARDKPVASLIWQTLTVRQAGRKVLKPLIGDDDLFRAFMLGGSRFLNEEIQKQYALYGGVRQAMGSGGFVAGFSSMTQGRGGGGPRGGSGGQSVAKFRGFGRK